MFNLECTTFRPYGPTMAILDLKIAIFGHRGPERAPKTAISSHIWPFAALAASHRLNMVDHRSPHP